MNTPPSNGVLLRFLPFVLAGAARRAARGESIVAPARDEDGLALRLAVR